MIRIFRAVIKRGQKNESDPVFCNFMTREILDPLKTKFDLDRVKKFQINRTNYVALGLITDLDDINENDLTIDITYVKSVNKISFREHQYLEESAEIPILSKITYLNEMSGNIGNLMFTAVEANRKNINCWDLYVSREEYDSNKKLINTILNSELNYGRKRKKFIISD